MEYTKSIEILKRVIFVHEINICKYSGPISTIIVNFITIMTTSNVKLRINASCLLNTNNPKCKNVNGKCSGVCLKIPRRKKQ